MSIAIDGTYPADESQFKQDIRESLISDLGLTDVFMGLLNQGKLFVKKTIIIMLLSACIELVLQTLISQVLGVFHANQTSLCLDLHLNLGCGWHAMKQV